jgi:hypothetical protein
MANNRIITTQRKYHPEDIAVWPDASWTHLDDLEAALIWKSDDFEIVAQEDISRLRELGIYDEVYPDGGPQE